MSDFDVIVIGAGSPGEHCAGVLAEGGLRVAVVERELVGGECSYYACIPSKTLLRPGEAVQAARDALATADVDVEATFAWRDFMVSDHSDDGQVRWLADNGITLLRGTGRLAGTGVVEVDGTRHSADHVVLAAGADAVIPPVPGLRELGGVWTSSEATSMKTVPGRLVILGAGPVGVEMAQVVQRLGGQAVLVEGAPHVLPHEPAALGEALGDVLLNLLGPAWTEIAATRDAVVGQIRSADPEQLRSVGLAGAQLAMKVEGWRYGRARMLSAFDDGEDASDVALPLELAGATPPAGVVSEATKVALKKPGFLRRACRVIADSFGFGDTVLSTLAGSCRYPSR